MAHTPSLPAIRPANLSLAQIRAGIPKLERRRGELAEVRFTQASDADARTVLRSAQRRTNATLAEVFGRETYEYETYSVSSLLPSVPLSALNFQGTVDRSIRGNKDQVASRVKAAIQQVEDALVHLREQLEDEGSASRTLRAYEGLELHPEIARAASGLYRDGHYANAVEAAVKALNGLVRLRSGLEVDGTSLMERAFNPSNPVMKFNALGSQSDKDEQKGFMNMFSGAVSGLRNPRAHGFIEDDPERALEFIAFVSLLAKLLDGAAT